MNPEQDIQSCAETKPMPAEMPRVKKGWARPPEQVGTKQV